MVVNVLMINSFIHSFDSFRSEVNGSLYEWFIESLGLLDLKWIIIIRAIGVGHQSTARAKESRWLLMLLNRSRGTLMYNTDRSDDDPLQIQRFKPQIFHPIRSNLD